MGAFIWRMGFGLFVVLFAATVHAFCGGGIVCGSVPTDGCDVNTSVTFTTGTYNLPQGIDICTPNVTVNCAGATLNGGGSGMPGVNVFYPNTTIRNCTITNYSTGLVSFENNTRLFTNHFSNMTGISNGVVLQESNGHLVQDNTFDGSSLRLQDANNSQITLNDFINPGFNNALTIARGSGNTVTNNTLQNVTVGIKIDQTTNNIVSNNTISQSVSGIRVEFGSDAFIQNNTLTSNQFGLEAVFGKNVFLTNNDFIGNDVGIQFMDVDDGIIDGGTIAQGIVGIRLTDVQLITIQGMEIHDNEEGINVGDSANVDIHQNKVFDNTESGIISNNSTAVLVNQNDIYHNNQLNIGATLVENHPEEVMDASNNYWNEPNAFGHQDCAIIDGTIGDSEDGATYGLPLMYVKFNQVLNAPVGTGIAEDKCTPLLLVHGTYSNDNVWDVAYVQKLTERGMRYYKVGEENGLKGLVPNNGNIWTLGAQVGEAVASVRTKTGEQKIDVIAHSMGGLAARVYTTLPLYSNDIRKIVFLGVPHGGVPLAKGFISGLVGVIQGDEFADTARKQQLPKSNFLTNLNALPVESTIDYSAIAGDKLSDKWYLKFATWLIDSRFVGNPPEIVSDNLVGVSSADYLGACYQHPASHSDAMGTSLTSNSGVVQATMNLLQNKPAGSTECLPYEEVLENALPTTFFDTQFTTQHFSIPSQTTQTMLLDINGGNHLSIASVSPSAQPNLNLTTPAGGDVNKETYTSYPGVEYQEDILDGNYFQWITIPTPQSGNWQVKINMPASPASTLVDLHVARKTNMQIDTDVTPGNAQPGNPLLITMTLLDGNGLVPGSNASARVTQPNGGMQTITLFDDGLHGDRATGDGSYANTYNDTNQEGYYEIEIDANGFSGGDTYHFSAFEYAFVEGKIDLMMGPASIVFSDPFPDANELITITAHVQNIGLHSSKDVNVLFYDGNPIEGGLLLGKSHLMAVGPGQTLSTNFNWVIPAGQHQVYVMVDPYTAYYDENYSNQLRSKKIFACSQSQTIPGGLISSKCYKLRPAGP